MEQHLVKIKSIRHITHDVLQIVTEKPQEYSFNPGQATEIAINKTGWKDEKRPFSFTSLPENDDLEFTIKTYPTHHGVTNELLNLENGDELILHEVFGAIAYKGEGVFIAGGAGITPFICIFRYLQSMSETGDNKLIFANNTREDIILALEFKEILGENFINILSGEITDEYANGQIDQKFLKANITDFGQQFYICGPPPMMEAIQMQLDSLGVNKKNITVEEME
jgi:ferredoxin-NADP reductase